MLLAGDRLTLRSTANKPREVTYERNGERFALLRLFSVGSEPTLALDDGRTFAIRLEKRFELAHPDEGPRIAWREEGGLLRADRICLPTGDAYELKTKHQQTTLKRKRTTIAAMELKGSSALSILQTDIRADALDELILAAATSVFLALRPASQRRHGTADPKAGDSFGIQAAAFGHGPG